MENRERGTSDHREEPTLTGRTRSINGRQQEERRVGGEEQEIQAYRPISLLNTLGKALESILAQRIAYAVEKHRLLPKGHLGGRKGMSAEHALHGLVEKVYQAWNAGDVASLLLLDVSGAFDHVSHVRLLHNLRKRKVDQKTVGWIASFLEDRSTTIQLREHTTKPRQINTGIPEGSPISPTLYLFYKADILKDSTREDPGGSNGGWIDDIYFFTHSVTTVQNCRTRRGIHYKAERWSSTRNSKFDQRKY